MIEAEAIKGRFEAAKSKRARVEAELEAAFYYTSPEGWTTAGSEPDRSNQYDDTAEDAASLLVNTILSYLLPQDQRWVAFVLSESLKQQLGATTQFDSMLESEERKFYEALNASKFYLAASQALKDCVIAGVGGIGVQAGDKGLIYKSLPVHELYFLDDGACTVDTVFRSHAMAARVVAARWKSAAPTWLTELAESKPDDEVAVIEAMIPDGSKFEYTVWLEKDWCRLESMVSDYPCFVVFRWDAGSASIWGSSPVRKALPSIRVLNRITCDVLDDAAYAARGLWTASDDSLKDAKPEPGSIIITNDPDGLRPVPFPGQLQVGVQMIESYRERVRQNLMADVLPSSGRMTTDEVNIRQNQFFRRIGTYALRLEEEFLEPIVRSSVLALQQAGRMERFDINGNPVLIETRSLVRRVQAQRQVEEVLMLIQAATALGPAGTQHIDTVKSGRFILERGGYPPSLLKPEAQVEAELKGADMVQAGTGLVQSMSGQGNPETSKATGEAMGRIGPDVMQAVMAQVAGKKAA